MNIENIKILISNDLGGDFAVFYNTDIDAKEAALLNNKALAVFRVNAGDIQPLAGVSGLTADCMLELLLPYGVEDKDRAIPRKYETAINKLLSDTNGRIETNEFYDGSDETVIYRYVISYGVPRATGQTMTFDGITVQQYVLDFKVVFSASAAFGNEIRVWVDGTELGGIINWNETGDLTLVNNFGIDEFGARFISALTTYKLSLTLIRSDFMSTDHGVYTRSSKQRQIQENCQQEKDVTYAVTAEINGLSVSFNAIIERYSLTGVKGDFQTMTLLFAKVQS